MTDSGAGVLRALSERWRLEGEKHSGWLTACADELDAALAEMSQPTPQENLGNVMTGYRPGTPLQRVDTSNAVEDLAISEQEPEH